MKLSELAKITAEKGLSYKSLAEKSGVSQATISAIVSGKGCSTVTTYKLAKALEVQVDELLGKEN